MKTKKLLVAVLAVFCAISEAFAADKKPAKKEKLGQLLGMRAEQAGSSLVVLNLEGKNINRPRVVSQGENTIVLCFPKNRLPSEEFERNLDTPLVPKVKLENIDDDLFMTLITDAAMTMRDIKGPNGADTMTVRLERLEQKPVVSSKPTPQAPPMKPQDAKKLVTLDLRDAELQDIFRMLGKFMGVNVLVDAAVPHSTMTLLFKNVPLIDVFQYVIRSNGLSYANVGGTLIVGPRTALGKTLGKTTVVGYRVSYGEPQKVATMINQMTDLGTTPNSVVVDERLRQIYVTGTAAQQEEVKNFLQNFDHPGKQVMIKSRIVEISDTGTDQFKTTLNAVYDWWWASFSNGQFQSGFLQSGQKSGTATNSPVYTNNDPTSITLPQTTTNTLMNAAGNAIRLLDFNITALVEKDEAKVLADPTVVTIDGQKASVKLVDKLKYISERDDAGNPTYSDEEVGPKLEITPIIGRDGVITVTVKLSTGEIVEWKSGSQGEEVPQTTNREVTSQVRVRNGEPFVIGGLFKDNISKTVNKIPILGDIPLLGELFKSRTSKKIRTQVVMVLIPYILDIGDGAIQGINIK